MTAHSHDWQPVAGQRGRYVCGCGVQGYRPARGGGVREAKGRRPILVERTVSSRVLAAGQEATDQGGCHVRCLPRLDRLERGRR